MKYNPIIINDDLISTLIDYEMSDPIPLHKADLSIPFVYDRFYGVFYVAGGYHILAMTLLYAWRYGYKSIQEMKRKNKEFKQQLTDNNCYSFYTTNTYISSLFLCNEKGTAMLSSVSPAIQIGSLGNLNEQEKIIFSNHKLSIIE